MKMNPYRFLQQVMDAWPAWAAICGVWIVVFAGTGSPATASLVVACGVVGLAALAGLMIGWFLLASWLRDQADAWDARRREGVPSGDSEMKRPPAKCPTCGHQCSPANPLASIGIDSDSAADHLITVDGGKHLQGMLTHHPAALVRSLAKALLACQAECASDVQFPTNERSADAE